MHVDETSAIKSIGNSTTAIRDLESNEDVKMIFMVLCDSVCRRLREHGARAGLVGISVRDVDLFSFTRQHKLFSPTDITEEVTRAAMELFLNNYGWEKNIRSVGVCLSELHPVSEAVQLTMLSDETSRERLERLDRSLDELKHRFGSFCVRPATLMKDIRLSGFSPKEEHVIHPVGYF